MAVIIIILYSTKPNGTFIEAHKTNQCLVLGYCSCYGDGSMNSVKPAKNAIPAITADCYTYDVT